MNNNDELPTTTEAIRSAVFRRARTINQQLLVRLEEVENHLGSGSHLAVIGALEGVEANIASMRSLMLMLRDCFAPAPSEGGPS